MDGLATIQPVSQTSLQRADCLHLRRARASTQKWSESQWHIFKLTQSWMEPFPDAIRKHLEWMAHLNRPICVCEDAMRLLRLNTVCCCCTNNIFDLWPTFEWRRRQWSVQLLYHDFMTDQIEQNLSWNGFSCDKYLATKSIVWHLWRTKKKTEAKPVDK